MDLREAVTAGVIVEFRDALGNSAGTAVYFDWKGRPLPAVGDSFSCRVATTRSGCRIMSGCVKFRRFDVQTDDNGHPCVWVRLVVDLASVIAPDRRSNGPVSFSQN